jgi:hypothetical protein
VAAKKKLLNKMEQELQAIRAADPELARWLSGHPRLSQLLALISIRDDGSIHYRAGFPLQQWNAARPREPAKKAGIRDLPPYMMPFLTQSLRAPQAGRLSVSAKALGLDPRVFLLRHIRERIDQALLPLQKILNNDLQEYFCAKEILRETARDLFSLAPSDRIEIVRLVVGRIARLSPITNRANLMRDFLVSLGTSDPRPDAGFYRIVLEIARDEPGLGYQRPPYRSRSVRRSGRELNFRNLLYSSSLDNGAPPFFRVLAQHFGSDEAARLVDVLIPQRPQLGEPSLEQVDDGIARLCLQRGLDPNDPLTKQSLRGQVSYPYTIQKEIRDAQKQDREKIIRVLKPGKKS